MCVILNSLFGKEMKVYYIRQLLKQCAIINTMGLRWSTLICYLKFPHLRFILHIFNYTYNSMVNIRYAFKTYVTLVSFRWWWWRRCWWWRLILLFQARQTGFRCCHTAGVKSFHRSKWFCVFINLSYYHSTTLNNVDPQTETLVIEEKLYFVCKKLNNILSPEQNTCILTLDLWFCCDTSARILECVYTRPKYRNDRNDRNTYKYAQHISALFSSYL